jgi:hypothetical protein
VTCKQLSWDFLSLLGGNEEGRTRSDIQEIPWSANISLLRPFFTLGMNLAGFEIAHFAEILVANPRAAIT